MMKIQCTTAAWNEYLYWQQQDKKTLKRINALLKDIMRGHDEDGSEEGIGKPEALKGPGRLAGFWSRRIDAANRLVYRIVEEENGEGVCQILQCKGHYDD